MGSGPGDRTSTRRFEKCRIEDWPPTSPSWSGRSSWSSSIGTVVTPLRRHRAPGPVRLRLRGRRPRPGVRPLRADHGSSARSAAGTSTPRSPSRRRSCGGSTRSTRSSTSSPSSPAAVLGALLVKGAAARRGPGRQLRRRRRSARCSAATSPARSSRASARSCSCSRSVAVATEQARPPGVGAAGDRPHARPSRR